MPPKKNDKAAGKKTAAAKVVEDKTFGMKNKKGGVAQKQIAQITAQAKSGGSAEQKKKEAERAAREREKKAAEDAKREAERRRGGPGRGRGGPGGGGPGAGRGI